MGGGGGCGDGMKKGADFMIESVTQRDIYHYYYQPFTCFRFLLNKKHKTQAGSLP